MKRPTKTRRGYRSSRQKSKTRAREAAPTRAATKFELELNPPSAPYEVYTAQPSELVIGLVGPLGTDNEKIRLMIAERLRDYGYRSEVIKISSVLIPALAGPENIPAAAPKYERAKDLIDLGNQIRQESKNNAILAIAAAAENDRRRPSPGEVQKIAYIVSSLKLPEEVAELRKIYGGGFMLVAVHTDREQRVRNLTGDGGKEMTRAHAWELITRDEHEPEEYGEHTRDTFHLADFFLADENNDDTFDRTTGEYNVQSHDGFLFFRMVNTLKIGGKKHLDVGRKGTAGYRSYTQTRWPEGELILIGGDIWPAGENYMSHYSGWTLVIYRDTIDNDWGGQAVRGFCKDLAHFRQLNGDEDIESLMIDGFFASKEEAFARGKMQVDAANKRNEQR